MKPLSHPPECNSDVLSAIKDKLADPNKTKPPDPLVGEHIKNSQTDRKLKKIYAYCFIALLIGQLILMSAIFFYTGLGKLQFDGWLLELYMSGTLAEVFGVVSVITKYLFPTERP